MDWLGQVLKFADWYADCFATDEERDMVLGVKIPSHSNLAACSYRLRNFQHAVVHCGQVHAWPCMQREAKGGMGQVRLGRGMAWYGMWMHRQAWLAPCVHMHSHLPVQHVEMHMHMHMHMPLCDHMHSACGVYTCCAGR